MKKYNYTLWLVVFLLSASVIFGQIADDKDTISIKCPDSVLMVGEVEEFEAIMPSAAALKDLVFNWTVSSGEITDGQGTRKIKVLLPLEDTTIRISVKVDGLSASIKNTDSCVAIAVPPPSAELASELSVNNGYEILLAELDNFFLRLQNNPSAKGYIVIYAEKGGNTKNFVRELQIKDYLKLRRIDPTRFIFIRGKSLVEAITQFWIVPLGIDPSEILELEAVENSGADDWSYDLSKTKKPFILGTQTLDCALDCGTYRLELYAEYLKANPKFCGNIVIYETTSAKYRQTAKEIKDELENLGISPRQIKTFFVRAKERQFIQPLEIWLVPPK